MSENQTLISYKQAVTKNKIYACYFEKALHTHINT